MRDQPAIQYMTEEDAETINACVTLAYSLLYGDRKAIESIDDRVSEERLLEVIRKLMPDKEM